MNIEEPENLSGPPFSAAEVRGAVLSMRVDPWRKAAGRGVGRLRS